MEKSKSWARRQKRKKAKDYRESHKNMYYSHVSVGCECKYCAYYSAGIAMFVKHLKGVHHIDILSEHLGHIPHAWSELQYKKN